MPGNNFIIACRDLRHLEVAVPVGDGIVRMPYDHHLGVHPNVTGIAADVDESLSVHAASRHLVLERKRQVVIGGTRHVHRVQRRVAAVHLQIALKRDQKNVGFVPATALVEELTWSGQIQRFSLLNVFEIHHGISDAFVGAHDQTL